MQAMTGRQPITQQQLNDLRAAFEMFDLDKDGRITCSELMTVMKNMRQAVTDAEVKDMIQNVDIDGNGTVEFEEFLQMMSARMLKQANVGAEERNRRMEKEARQAFAVFDIDGDGLIDSDELLQTMTNLGEKVTKADVQAMIRTADKNGDGKIDFQEFFVMMKHRR